MKSIEGNAQPKVERNSAPEITAKDRSFMRDAARSKRGAAIITEVPQEFIDHNRAVEKFKAAVDQAKSELGTILDGQKLADFARTKQIHLLDDIRSLSTDTKAALKNFAEEVDRTFEARGEKLLALHEESLRLKGESEEAFQRAVTAQATEAQVQATKPPRERKVSGVYARPAKPTEHTVVMEAVKLPWYQRAGGAIKKFFASEE